MIRRNFLRRLTATAAGLLIADDALAMLVEPRRKVWPGWTAPGEQSIASVVTVSEELIRDSAVDVEALVRSAITRAMKRHWDLLDEEMLHGTGTGGEPIGILAGRMITVAYYTRDTPYQYEARILCASLGRVGMEHDIEPIDSVGDWFDNTALKAEFIRRMREKHTGAMLYVDVDAFVHANCDPYFDGLNAVGADFAAHWFAGPAGGYKRNVCPCVKGEPCDRAHRLLSGTLYFGDTKNARYLIQAWCNRNYFMARNGVREGGGQKNLWQVVTQAQQEGWLRDVRLSGRYTYVFDKSFAYPADEPCWIEHTIASRDNRPHDDGRPKRPDEKNDARQKRRAELARMVNVEEAA